jgi:drug/metabolite transporter (DMT)-like permease
MSKSLIGLGFGVLCMSFTAILIRMADAPALVRASVLAEPVGSTVLAYMILEERVPPITLIGGGLVLTGLYMVISGRRENEGR